MKRSIMALMVILTSIGVVFSEGQQELGNKKVVVGFSQIGSDAGWRDAETTSIKGVAVEYIKNVDLRFSDAQDNQENQIKAVESFIDMKVDYIGLAPIVATGWDSVLLKAKKAGIPVIFIDRKAKVSDDLYTTFIGSDFTLEGKNAAKAMGKLLDGKGAIVELEGTEGASVSNDRKKGFHDEMKKSFPNIKILESKSGDFSTSKGQSIMASYLKKYGDKIDGVYAHSDNMVLGAIEAIRESGREPGVDVKTVSIDAIGEIFLSMVYGEANVTVECSPLLGPQFFKAIYDLERGKTLPRWIKSNEGIFWAETAMEDIDTRQY